MSLLPLRRSFLCLHLLVASSVFAASPMIVAHRGASHAAPENTIAAFELAWQESADAVEGDFYLTADNQIVCIHDANTQRTAGIKRIVAESTLAELRELEYGSWKDERYRGEPIPTLADVIANLTSASQRQPKRLVIELKTGPEIVAPMVAELSASGIDLAQVMVIAFNASTVEAVKEALPEVQTHWLTGFKQDRVTGRVAPSAETIVRTVRRSGADGVGMKADRSVVTPSFVDQLRQGGVGELHFWTINDPAAAEYFASFDPVGITTDRPGTIGGHLRD